MITVYAMCGGSIERFEGVGADVPLSNAAWIDLYAPNAEEIASVEAALSLKVPAREQMQEIETSSRLRHDPNSLCLTVSLLSNVSSPKPQIGAVTFILSHQRLVTLRYSEPYSFRVFSELAIEDASVCNSGTMAMIGLFGAVIDRVADIVEMAGQDVEALAHEIFSQADHTAGQQSYKGLIQRIGRIGDIVSKARESMMSLSRALTFLSLTAADVGAKKDLRNRLKTESQDLASVSHYADFVNEKITFILDATLGLVAQQQNTIMKIFSVLAMVFLPPTLVGSVYGMNFQDMPELDWRFGYPMALVLMLMSAVLPYLFFKRKGWL